MESPTSTTVDGTPLADDALCNSPVKRTHSYLRQRLVMETSIERNAHKCNPQANSPLWNTLPEELRLMVSPSTEAVTHHVLRLPCESRADAYLVAFVLQTHRYSKPLQHSTRTCPELINSTRINGDPITERPSRHVQMFYLPAVEPGSRHMRFQ
jgi:hypothetical protein